MSTNQRSITGTQSYTTKFAERVFHPDEEYKPTITVERDVLPIIIQHGMELFWDESTPTKRLDDRDGSSLFTRFVNARIEGKLTEVAFTQLLEERFDVGGAVDYRIYGDYAVTDEGDVQYLYTDDNDHYKPGVEFDLKKTKPWNSWLAIRKEIFNKLDSEAPVILSKMRIEPDIQLDPWKDTEGWDDVEGDEEFRNRLLQFSADVFPVEVEFVGTAYPDEFTDSFKQGDRLYDPVKGTQIGPPLKRDNEGIHVGDLDARATRWNRVIGEICSNMPPGSWRPLPVVDERD